MKTRTQLTPVLAVVIAASLAPAAAHAASPYPQLRIKAGPGSSALLMKAVTVKATCPKACTVALDSVSVQPLSKSGSGFGEAPSQTLKMKKRARPGKPATFKVALNTQLQGHLMPAVADRRNAIVTVAARINGAEGPYRTAAVRLKGTKKAALGMDDIPVAKKPRGKTRSRGRYRVSVKGVQTTDWSYDRSERRPDGCVTFARGSGKQVIRFKSRRTVTADLRRILRIGVLTRPGAKGIARLPIHLDITRDGKREAGVSGTGCDGGGSGGGDGGGGSPEQCIRTGDRDEELMFQVLRGNRGQVFQAEEDDDLLAPLTPTCPVETFEEATDDAGLLSATIRRGDPTSDGRPGKVILIMRNRVSEPIEGGGRTTTNVRYTVTFKKVR